jgi:TatD DNase family protein
LTPSAYVDTHCHLDRYARPVDVLKRALSADVTVVSVTDLPSSYQALVVKLGRRAGVVPALGLHPLRAAAASPLERSLFDRLLARAPFVGEVGLDFSREGQASRRAQLQVFEAILSHSAIGSKVLTVHSRRAEAETIERLVAAQVSAILHWYSGPAKHIERALAAGILFSINPAMLRSQTGARVLAAVPQDRVLIETDGPYVKISNRVARPDDVPVVVRSLAERWRLTPAEVAQTIRGTWDALLSRVSGAGSATSS